MRVLGIDPGLATTGYAILEWCPGRPSQPKILEAGVITTLPNQTLPPRLHSLFLEISRLVEEFKPDALAIEELIFSQNRTTAMAVAHARGVVLLAAHELPVKHYTPLQVKRRIVGYGRAPKLQMQRMIQQRLRLKELPKPDDAADALAIALCYVLEALGDLPATSDVARAIGSHGKSPNRHGTHPRA
jgi:crossover junction endodeoxyribonuclease RuvC